MAEKNNRQGRSFFSVLAGIGSMIYKLRSIFLSIPVVLAAIILAMKNASRLPETVGINLLASGEYQWLVARNIAVLGPLAVTILCLLMVFCSRRVVYPWLISIFSLAIPIVIWITNVFPA
ncbi:MAG: hypothetical protein IJO45_03065 [Oscillospiraceae bacterium]|nr:hypothetical protein [Oscillospiraceae bacterium]